MPRELPTVSTVGAPSALTPSKTVSGTQKPRHLSIIPAADAAQKGRLTRGQVATRLGISISTVRRFEGTRLHPTIDDGDVRWFDSKEVASLAAELVNTSTAKRKGASTGTTTDVSPARPPGELAALVFERFEQRQSLAEIVIGLRVQPETVRALFDQWSLGLIEGQLRLDREPSVQRANELQRVKPAELAARLAELPHGQLTRISVARFRERYVHGDHEYARLDELGGFHVSGPCTTREITRRYGSGRYRVTAYDFAPGGLCWELLVEGLVDGE